MSSPVHTVIAETATAAPVPWPWRRGAGGFSAPDYDGQINYCTNIALSVREDYDGSSLDEEMEDNSGINTHVFDELKLDDDTMNETIFSWQTYIDAAGSREAAGEALYTAIFDSSPAIQARPVPPY